MDQQQIELTRKKIYQHLESSELQAAISILRELIPLVSDWHFFDHFYELERNYKLLLHSFANNQDDRNRKTVFAQLLASGYQLTDELLDKLLLELSIGTLYLTKKRVHISSKSTVDHVLNSYEQRLAEHKLSESYQYLKVIFEILWTSPLVLQSSIERILEYISSPLVPMSHKLDLISALTLSLLQNFKSRLFDFLLHLLLSSDREIALRATVGFMLVLDQWHDRINLYDSFVNQVKELIQNEVIAERITIIQLLLIRSKDTERIIKKFNEEILPEMIRMSKKYGENISHSSDADPEELNPDWEDFIKGSKLEQKLKEVNELQVEGADFMMSTFSNLKSFPFFDVLSNWFLPFDPDHPEIQSNHFPKLTESEHLALIDFIEHSRNFCHSDKYSFYISVVYSADSYKKNMMTQMHTQHLEENKGKDIPVPLPSEEVVLNLYIRDWYRFFKLYKRKQEFKDAFESNFYLFQLPILSPVLSQKEILKEIGNLYFKKKYYDDAVLVYEMLNHQDQTDIEVNQKLGFCFQKICRYQDAINCYLKADLLTSNQAWTMKHLAQCYRDWGKYAEALKCYLELLKLKPDDLYTQIQVAHSYLFNHNPEEALQYYYKVNFANPDLMVAKRGVAWCSFLLKKYTNSAKIYAEILQSKDPKPYDFINVGHLALVQGDREGALTEYRRSITFDEYSYEQWLETFEQDELSLRQLGVDELTFKLLKEVLALDLPAKYFTL